MSDGTKIEWTDATVNAINGCTVLSPGCTNCYAMKQAHRFPVRQGLTRKTNGGMVWTGEVRLSETALLQPLRWQRPRKIFWNAHGDMFHEKVPDEWIDRCFDVMEQTPHHIHQVLTKRPERMRHYFTSGYRIDQGSLENVWLGVSVEDQKRADERIPILLDTPAAVRWLSMEPLLGPVDLTNITGAEKSREYGSPVHGWSCIWRNNGLGRNWVDWVVLGGESGPGARPMHPDWARSLRDQCAAAGVPFLFKQWGDWLGGKVFSMQEGDVVHGGFARHQDGTTGQHGGKPDHWWSGDTFGGIVSTRVGKKVAGRMLDGVHHDGFPT